MHGRRGVLHLSIAAMVFTAALTQANSASVRAASGSGASGTVAVGGYTRHVVPPPTKLAPGAGIPTVRRPRIPTQPLATTPATWSEVGPQLIDTNGTDPEKYAAGRVLSLASTKPDTNNQYTLYSGTADGGVWKSADAGLDWTPLTDTQLNSLIVGALAVDPSNNATVYAGTGDAVDPVSFFGYGFYKSTDSGATWTQYNNDANGNDLFTGRAVSAIAVDPTNSNLVYAALVDGQTGADVGVLVSTNGGQTWTHNTGTGTLDGLPVSDLTIDASGNLYAAVVDSGKASVYYSNNHGASWTLVSTGLPTSGVALVKIALKPSTASSAQGSQTVYAAVGGASRFLLGVYRTDTGGTGGWSAIGTPPTVDTTKPCPTAQPTPPAVPDYFPSLTNVDPTTNIPNCEQAGQADGNLNITADGNALYLGRIDVMKTNDASVAQPQWYNLTNGYYPKCPDTTPVYDGATARQCGVVSHVDQHFALAVPTSPSTVFFGNDGGVYQSPDAGRTFVNANGAVGASLTTPDGSGIGPNPLRNTQYYAGAITSDRTRILGGTQDNGTTYSIDSGATHKEVIGGDGFFDAIDTTNGYLYGENPNAKIYRGSRDGTNFTKVRPSNESAAFSAPLVIDPTSPNILYSGEDQVYRTANSGTTWTNIGPTGSTGKITAMTLSPPATTMYVGYTTKHLDSNGSITSTTGTVWVSPNVRDTTPTWTQLGTVSDSISGLAVDPNDSTVVYVSVNSYQATASKHLYRGSSAGGAFTLTDISATLPNVPFQSVTVDPANHQTVYAGGYRGVYRSTDGGSNWTQFGANLPNAEVFYLLPVSGTLYAFTHGRGIWKVSIAAAAPTAAHVSLFTAQRTGRQLHFTWTLRAAGSVIGFSLYAGTHRLNQRPIATHRSSLYRYTARWAGHGPYTLHLIMRNGQVLTVGAQ